MNAIYNFQKYFGIWIHFNNEAFRLAPLFLNFLRNRNEQYLTLRLDDLYAMWTEHDAIEVYEDMIKMLDFSLNFRKIQTLKKLIRPTI